MASHVPGQSVRGHQWQDAPKLTARVFASQRDAFTAVFYLQRANPAGVLVDDGVRMTRHELFPPFVRAHVDQYHPQSMVRLTGSVVRGATHEAPSTNTSAQLQGRRKSPNRPLIRN